MIHTLPQEELKELAKLHKEREALSERIRKIDKSISERLGIASDNKPKKKTTRKDMHSLCL